MESRANKPVHRKKYNLVCKPSKDSDQLAHLLGALWVTKDGMIPNMHSKNSNQTEGMCRLI